MAANVKTYKLLCEYRFKPTLLFYDAKNQIGQALFKDYKHWTHDGLRINLTILKTEVSWLSIITDWFWKLTYQIPLMNSEPNLTVLLKNTQEKLILKIISGVACGPKV